MLRALRRQIVRKRKLLLLASDAEALDKQINNQITIIMN
jgi:hypothetical protein